MCRCTPRSSIVLLLVFAFLHAYVVPAYAGAANKDQKNPKVRVAFLGVKFEGTPEDVKKRLYARYEDLLKDRPMVIYKNPEDVRVALGSEMVERLLSEPDSAAYRLAAEKLDVDHIFSGRIADHSRDQARILLVGELYRYDRKIRLLHKFDILKYYDLIGVEFLKFDQEYVQTIIPERVQKKATWVWLVLAGVGAATLLTLTVIGSKFGADERGEGGSGEPTDF